MKILKRILLVLLIVVVLIQFIRPERNISKGSELQIRQSLQLPADVEVILKKACYDCHSNNTRYPWYAHIQPVAGFMANHIKKGKSQLNFNRLSGLNRRRQRSLFRGIEEVIEEGSMPLSSYTLLHEDAKLTQTEREILINWAGSAEDRVH